MLESQIFFPLSTAPMDSAIYPDIQGNNRSFFLQCVVNYISNFLRAFIMQKGCSCRFLYGPGTDQDKITEIEKALEARTELQVEVQFYRKNGK